MEKIKIILKMTGKYEGESDDGYHMLRCPFCGEISYIGDWTSYGVIEDAACDHWGGDGYFVLYLTSCEYEEWEKIETVFG